MTCQTCGTTNPAHARFCMQCGRAQTGGYVCAQCFTHLPSEARFCFHCGAMVVAGGAQQHAAVHTAHLPAVPAAAPAGAASQPVLPTRLQRSLPDLLPSFQRYLPGDLYEPLERKPTDSDLRAVRDHLVSLLGTAKTYLPRPVVLNPQPAGQPAGGMLRGTFLFVDVSGFTPLSERLSVHGRAGAERVTDIMNDLFYDLVSVLFAHGGSLLKFGGDAVLGVFAADSAEEMAEGALLAAHAAVAMQGVMEKYAAIEAGGTTSALRVKIGLSSGEYFGAHIGTGHNMAYVTTGHTVNRAEEAEGNAEAGEIVLADTTFELLRDNIAAETRAEGYYMLAGIMREASTDGRALVIPEDSDPPGDIHAQLAYLADRLDRLTPYMAADLLPRIITNPTRPEIDPEHRPVTVMFVNYVGISDLVNDLGDTHPEIITQQLNTYFVRMAGIVEKYEGTLARMDQYAVGDRLVIFFGAPRAHEDDPVRAVYTALDMQKATQKEFSALQTPEGIFRFRQRIGINTGHLFAGNVGAPNLRQEYTLMGDDINMAARLMSKADWGDIFISRRTRDHVQAFFDLEDKGELKVKGKEILIPTYRVVQRSEAVGKTRGLGTEAPLTGREEALTAVTDCAKQVIAGRGQILSIIGDSGRGKSRLTRELKRAIDAVDGAERLRWYEGQALSFSENINYWLMAQILHRALDLGEDVSDEDLLFTLWEKGEQTMGREVAREAIPFLAYLLGINLEGDWAEWVAELEPRARQKQTAWAIREFFKASAEFQPVVIVLDDLHWADEASLVMLENMLEISDRSPIMFCLVFRERRDKGVWNLRNRADSSYSHRYKEVILPPLTPEQSSNLLNSLLPGAELTPEAREQILEKAAGNPFYLEEVVRTLIDSGAVVPDAAQGEHWVVTDRISDIAVPDTLHGAIVARIDRLTEDARRALQIAAVIGRRFQLEVFRRLLGAGDDMEMWLAQLERSGLVRPLGQSEDVVYAFPDALVQEVAYDSLLDKQRKEFHRRIAKTIEESAGDDLEPVEDMLAYHYCRSDDDDKAVVYLEKVGQRAQREFANETALMAYTLLLGHLERVNASWKQHFDVLNRRQQVYALLGKQELREKDLEAMRALTVEQGDDDRQADALSALADLYQWTGRYDEALASAREALDIEVRTGDAAGQAFALHSIGVVNYYRGDYDEANESLRKAADIRRELGDRSGESWSSLYLTMTHVMTCEYGHALTHVTTALAAAEANQDWMLIGIHLNNGGRIHTRLGNYETAMSQFTRSLEMRERIGDRTGMGFTQYGIGLVHTYMDDLDAAEQAFRDSLIIRTEINDERGISYCQYGMGLVLMKRGSYETAEKSLVIARQTQEKLSLKGELIATLSALGQVKLALGKHDEAKELSAAAVDMLPEQPALEEKQGIYFNHYRVLIALEDEDAREYLEKAHAEMMKQADAIDDEDVRRMFIEKVRVNQEITAALAADHGEQSPEATTAGE